MMSDFDDEFVKGLVNIQKQFNTHNGVEQTTLYISNDAGLVYNNEYPHIDGKYTIVNQTIGNVDESSVDTVTFSFDKSNNPIMTHTIAEFMPVGNDFEPYIVYNKTNESKSNVKAIVLRCIDAIQNLADDITFN